MPHRLSLVVVLVALACLPSVATAQDAQRSALVGTVSDGSGAVIEGASIVLTGALLIGGPRTVASSSSGQYRFAMLLPGVYSIAVSAPGFATLTRTAIPLPIETTYTVDFKVEVSPLHDRVEVTTGAPLIDVQSAAAPTHFDSQMLQHLPTGRTLESVLNLAPGVTDDVAYGGTQRSSNTLAVDGIRLVEPYIGNAWASIGYNWLEAVQVVALGAPAEYGEFTGAIVNGVIRSGGNAFRGLTEYVAAVPNWTGDNTGSLPERLQSVFTPKDILTWWDVNAQVGGPIRRDRLSFFAGAGTIRQDYRQFGYRGPASTAGYEPRFVLKVDAAPSRDWTLQAFYERDITNIDGVEISAGRETAETSADLRRRNHVWNGRANWALSDRTLIEMGVGGVVGNRRNEPHAPSTRSGPPPKYDVLTGAVSDNTTSWSDIDRASVMTSATASHLGRARGTHELRAGVQFERARVVQASGYPGGRIIYLEDGVPVGAEIWAGGREESTTTRATLFVQDRWALGHGLTLEPGLRVETYRGSVPQRGRVFQTNPVGIRFGAAWAPTTGGRTVLRGHYGRYFDMPFNYLYGFEDVSGVNPTITAEATGPDSFVETGREEPSSNNSVATHVKQSHMDQWFMGLERQVLDDLVIEGRVVYRRYGNFIGYIDPRLSEWTPFHVPDPGPDGRIGTADDSGSFTVYRPYPGPKRLVLGNPERASRRYTAVQALARKRFSTGWQSQVSYTWSRSRGLSNVANINAAFEGLSPGGIGANPNYSDDGPGAERPQFDYSEFKALGTYQARWLGGFGISGVYRWHTGTRWQRLVLVTQPVFVFVPVEPRGSRQLPGYGTADLRFEKTLRLPSGRGALDVYVEAFNLTNTGVATRARLLSGPIFGEPSGWTDPRVIRIGARYSF